jgi:CubicO group peptidase (beta-lactamase class C family)
MKRMGLIAVAAFALLLFAVYWLSDPIPDPVVMQLTPGPSPPRISLGEAGIDPAAVENAVAYATDRNTRALVVGRNGHIVFEKYWGGTNFDTPERLSGFTPVLIALSAGSAMNDHLIPSLDQPLSNFVPAFADGSSGKKTLRELIEHGDTDEDMGWRANLAAEAIERVTNQGYETIVAERLWKPMEGGPFTLERRSAAGPGAVRASCCMTARLGDWMRVGELLSKDGVYEGNELAPRSFVAQMRMAPSKDAKYGFYLRVNGGFAAHDVVWLESEGKQRLWIVPSLELVILRVGDEPPRDKGWDERMIPDTIIRGTSGWQSAKAGEAIDPNKFAPH